MSLIKKIGFAFVFIVFFSCAGKTYHYTNNQSLTDAKGLPMDSLSFYFSNLDSEDSSLKKFVKDSFWQNYLSSSLYAFKEPILYNKYLGRRVYRFLWLRSFDLPMVLSLINDDDKVTLNAKKLDRLPLTNDYRYSSDNRSEDSFYRAKGYKVLNEQYKHKDGTFDSVTVVKADRKANIIYDSTWKLTKSDWNEFEKLLKEAGFWKIIPYYWEGDTDGAVWVIEAHLPNRYRYIVRQSPSGKIHDAGVFLINRTGLKERIY